MKKGIRCIAFIVLLAMVMLTTYNVLKWKDTAGDYLSTTQQMYETEEGLMDVLFLGSSHSYCSISADVIWGEYGFATFGMNTSGQDKLSTYYYLKETLKTQSPKVVCVEMFGLTFDKHGVLGNEYRNMLSMNLSKNAIDLIQAYTEDEDTRNNYVLRWPIVHTRYKELDKYDFVTNDVNIYGRSVPGNYTAGWSAYPSEAMEYKGEGELTDSNKEWLESLYQLSIEEGFELIFFVAPYYISVEQQKLVLGAEEFAAEHNIPFLDFNRIGPDIGINYSTDFYDAGHLNLRGSEKVSSYFGRYFDENYHLEDKRGDARYTQWEQSYTLYQQIKMGNELSNAAEFSDYAELLKKMNHITVVVSLEGAYKDSTLDIEEMVLQLGLSKEDYDNGGKFIYADGKWQKALDNDSQEVFVYELNEYDAFKIQNAPLHNVSATNLDNVMLNMESVGQIYNGLSVVVYDDVRKMIVEKKGIF